MAKNQTTYEDEEALRKMTEVNLDDGDEEEGGKEIALRGGMAKVGGQWSTAITNIMARNPIERAKMLEQEAVVAGESFFYGWGAGKNRIEGPSVGLAMAAARIWGNCAVDFKEMQETDSSWVFTSYFIDLQTGFTLGRQFRQSKHSEVHGKHDPERKDDMRFQIGQSKAARNVVVNALPKWMISRAVEAAKKGVRARIGKYIEQNGLIAAVSICMKGLKKHGVTEEAVIDKFEKPNIEGLTLDDVVMMRGDLYALDENQDRAEMLYPLLKTPAGKQKAAATSSINEKLKAADAAAAAAKAKEGQQEDGGDAEQDEESIPFDFDACQEAFSRMANMEAVRTLFRDLLGPDSEQPEFSPDERHKITDWAMEAEKRIAEAEAGKVAKQADKAKEASTEPAKQSEPAAGAAESADPLAGISSSGEPEEFKLGAGDKKPANGGGKKSGGK